MKQFLALVAALLLLARPICDLQAASVAVDARSGDVRVMAGQHAGGAAPHDDMPCCAYFDDSALAKFGEAAVLGLAPEGEPAVALTAWHFACYARASESGAHPRPGVLPGPSSYYVRSARIRR